MARSSWLRTADAAAPLHMRRRLRVFTVISLLVLAAISASTVPAALRGPLDARLIGVFAAWLAIATVGSGVGWAAARFTGISAPLAVGAALAWLDGFLIVGVCLGRVPAAGLWLQLVSFVLASAIMYRPLTSWVAARSGPGLVIGTRGLSTVEYSVLFVVIVVGSLALWRKLSSSLHDQVSTGQTELIRAMSSANAKGSAPASPEPATDAAKGQGMQSGPSPVGSAPGMSPPSAAQAPAHTGSSVGQFGTQAPLPAFSQPGTPGAPAHSGAPEPSGTMKSGPPPVPPPAPVSKKAKRAAQPPNQTGAFANSPAGTNTTP